MNESATRVPSETELFLIVPKTPKTDATAEPEDRLGGVPQGLTVLNLSGLEPKPIEARTFVEKVLKPITSAMSAVQDKFKGLAVEEIKISLAVTAEGDIGIASAGVESSIEVTLKWRDGQPMGQGH